MTFLKTILGAALVCAGLLAGFSRMVVPERPVPADRTAGLASAILASDAQARGWRDPSAVLDRASPQRDLATAGTVTPKG